MVARDMPASAAIRSSVVPVSPHRAIAASAYRHHRRSAAGAAGRARGHHPGHPAAADPALLHRHAAGRTRAAEGWLHRLPFTRYYTGAPGYRRKGPPSPLLRLLGPFVLGLSLAVIASGGMLAITGPSGRMWLLVHKASFMLWLVGMSI